MLFLFMTITVIGELNLYSPKSFVFQSLCCGFRFRGRLGMVFKVRDRVGVRARDVLGFYELQHKSAKKKPCRDFSIIAEIGV